MKKFEELGLENEILKVIERLGFKEPSEIQEKAIPFALEGRDLIGGSATGSGKTLAFASPIIQNLIPNGKVQALVMTPTRELAEQVADAISMFSRNKKLNITLVYGGVGIEQQIRNLRRTDVVVGTPGRILDHLNRRTLDLRNVRFLVLDEFDRMLDMGFHYDVEKIINNCPKERQTMMFSATLSPSIDHLVKKYTKNAVEIAVQSYVDKAKLKQFYYDVPNHLKFSLLIHLLKKEKSNLIMVFCSTRRNADYVALNLKSVGINAMAIHGGMPQNKRMRVIDDFHGKGADILICTDVAARGLDIKGVSHVYNYDLPKTSDEYIHRIGRTARAGEEGKAISLLSGRDYENFESILKDDSLTITRLELPQLEVVILQRESWGERRDSRGSRRQWGGDRRGQSRGPRRDSRSSRGYSKPRR